MKVIIQTAFEKLYENETREVVLPGDDGELTILDFHQPLLCSLRCGYVQVIPRVLAEKKHIPIKYGIARISDNELKIMVEIP